MPTGFQCRDEDTLPLAARKRIDALCVRFERAWKAGTPPQLQEYAGGIEGAERSVLLHELIRLDLHYRRRSGTNPTEEEYTAALRPGDVAAVRAALGAATTLSVGPSAGAAAAAPPRRWPDVTGFRILDELGEGGMGVVYKAEQVRPPRAVALKMMHADRADPAALARFRREFEALARLEHENIVRLYEVGEAVGRPFFTMELVGGGGLNWYLRGSPLPPERAAWLVEVLARALDVVHRAGIVHRDLKPSNVLLALASGRAVGPPPAGSPPLPWPEGPVTPKIADFGLAKKADDSLRTDSREILGTAAYMAPEQAKGGGKEVGPAADVYALGAVLYECLTGRPPFQGDTVDVLVQVASEDPRPPRRLRREIPRDLEAVCLKCLEKSPKRRYASALELADDLRRFLGGEPTKARPRRWYQKVGRKLARRPLLAASAALLGVALAAAGVPFLAGRPDPDRPRKDLHAALAAGRAYRFEPREGLPGPFRQVFGTADTLERGADGESFIGETQREALWELTDEPPGERYRFSAWVRHDRAVLLSAVGLYFGHTSATGPAGPRRGKFFTLSFADRGSRVTLGKGGEQTSRVMIEPRVFEERPGGPYAPKGAPIGRVFRPVPQPEGVWRRLQVTVTPEGVVAEWEKEPGKIEVLGRLSAAELAQRTEDTKRTEGWADVPAVFGPRTGLGLYVRAGRASFRDVVLEPIGAGD